MGNSSYLRGFNTEASGTEREFVIKNKKEIGVVGAKTAGGTLWNNGVNNCESAKPDFALKVKTAKVKLCGTTPTFPSTTPSAISIKL